MGDTSIFLLHHHNAVGLLVDRNRQFHSVRLLPCGLLCSLLNVLAESGDSTSDGWYKGHTTNNTLLSHSSIVLLREFAGILSLLRFRSFMLHVLKGHLLARCYSLCWHWHFAIRIRCDYVLLCLLSGLAWRRRRRILKRNLLRGPLSAFLGVSSQAMKWQDAFFGRRTANLLPLLEDGALLFGGGWGCCLWWPYFAIHLLAFLCLLSIVRHNNWYLLFLGWCVWNSLLVLDGGLIGLFVWWLLLQ